MQRSGSCPYSPSRSRSTPVREPCRSGRPMFVVRADTDRVQLEGPGMKYMLLLGGTMEPEERAKNPELAAAYQRVGQWFEQFTRAGKIVEAHELQGPQTATTVRFKDGKPMVVDGPFIEAKEVIGGSPTVQG